MNVGDIRSFRLASQQLGQTAITKPDGMVRWLGAVQAQDYEGGLWSIGLRLPGSTRPEIERSLESRRIVRTWAMRGTLHMVPAGDIRWILALVAPGMTRRNARRWKELGLTDEDFRKGRELVTGALGGGRSMARSEIFRALEQGGISTEGQRGYHILFRLGLEALVCFGPRRGKEHTFVLFDEWVRDGTEMKRQEALAELARRYFTSHGPATLQDFTWWSGLAAAETRAGISSLAGEVTQLDVRKKTCFMAAGQEAYTGREAHLLPPYDEFFIAYRDRSAFIDRIDLARVDSRLTNFPFIIGGRSSGTWKKVKRKGAMAVRTRSFSSLERADIDALSAAVERYAAFLGLPGKHLHEEGPQ